ncbi:MAG: LLM class oxidoreductase [Colwellia sp.]
MSSSQHRGFKELFQPEKLTLGLMSPIESYQTDMPTLDNQDNMVKRAEALGFDAIWIRDVPLRDPHFGDVGQTYESFTYLAWLAAITSKIKLVSGSIVLPLRHPLHTAKQAASIDLLSNQRFIMGVASGDRAIEFPAFDVDIDKRGELFRENLSVIKKVLKESFPSVNSHYGQLQGADLIPKPSTELPIMITGGSSQPMEWIAENTDGWITYPRAINMQVDTIAYWKELANRYAPGEFKPFAQSFYLDLTPNPDAKPTRIHLGYRVGRNALIEMFQTLRNAGCNHIVMNLKYGQRPASEVIEELGEYVLPVFK